MTPITAAVVSVLVLGVLIYRAPLVSAGVWVYMVFAGIAWLVYLLSSHSDYAAKRFIDAASDFWTNRYYRFCEFLGGLWYWLRDGVHFSSK